MALSLIHELHNQGRAEDYYALAGAHTVLSPSKLNNMDTRRNGVQAPPSFSLSLCSSFPLIFHSHTRPENEHNLIFFFRENAEKIKGCICVWQRCCLSCLQVRNGTLDRRGFIVSGREMQSGERLRLCERDHFDLFDGK